MSTLNLYNTKSRVISAFKPIKKGEVGIYLCGATVQAPPHIGHIRSGVNFDILRRWLITSGYKVNFVRNVTDIDDKILHKAVHEEIPWWQVAMKYERAFTDAYNALNVLPPTYEPRATGHITQMIELMQKIDFNAKTVYDFGTGTGILAILAEKLGAQKVLAVDNDDWCIENAGENIQNNASKVITIEKVESALQKAQYDIVLANVNRHIIEANMDELTQIGKPGGTLVLSGLLIEDQSDIINLTQSKGWQFQEVQPLNGWVSLMFNR